MFESAERLSARFHGEGGVFTGLTVTWPNFIPDADSARLRRSYGERCGGG
jgi:hypothetical protein